MDLDIKIEKKREGVYLVSLSGSLDTATCVDCEAKIEPVLVPSTKAVVFDMEGLEYISSVGFLLIFKVKKAVESNGGVLAIANLKPDVKKVFETMKVVPKSLFDKMEDADRYLKASIGSAVPKGKKK